MDRIKAMTILSEIKYHLTAGNPVWDVDEIAEACDMAIEALRNEINCVKCVHYTERETYTGIKGVCKMDTAHRDDTVSRQDAIDELKTFIEDETTQSADKVWNGAIKTAIGCMRMVPTSANSPTGKWSRLGKILDIGDVQELVCDVCEKTILWVNDHYPNDEEPKYCPNCGADMRGDKDDG